MNLPVLLRPLLCVAVALTASCSHQSNPPYPRGSIETLYPTEPRPVLRQVSVQGRTLQLAEMKGSGHTPLLFLHGSPGDWQAWARYLDAPGLSAYSPRMAVDRPGFGGSGQGAVVTDLRAQATLIAELIPVGSPAIVVGHSLGGPLVGWLLLDHPEKFCGGVMVAGAIAPDLEAPRWYNRLAQTWLVQWLAPKEILWANTEIMALQRELQKLDAHWSQLRRPLIVLQGDRDELVDPNTADYAERHIPPSWLQVQRVPEQGHFVLWNQPEKVIAAINSLACKP